MLCEKIDRSHLMHIHIAQFILYEIIVAKHKCQSTF